MQVRGQEITIEEAQKRKLKDGEVVLLGEPGSGWSICKGGKLSTNCISPESFVEQVAYRSS